MTGSTINDKTIVTSRTQSETIESNNDLARGFALATRAAADAGNGSTTGTAGGTGATGSTGTVSGTGATGSTGTVSGTGSTGGTGTVSGAGATGSTGTVSGAGSTGSTGTVSGTDAVDPLKTPPPVGVSGQGWLDSVNKTRAIVDDLVKTDPNLKAIYDKNPLMFKGDGTQGITFTDYARGLQHMAGTGLFNADDAAKLLKPLAAMFPADQTTNVDQLIADLKSGKPIAGANNPPEKFRTSVNDIPPP